MIWETGVFETFNAFLALLAVAVNFTFAAMVFLRSSRNRVYITFALVCIGLIVWNFGEFMVYAEGGSVFPSTSPWKYWSSSGSSMAVAFLFHFICALERNVTRRAPWILGVYIGALFFAVSSPMAIFSDRVAPFVDGTAWNILFAAVLLPFLTFGVIILVRCMARAETREERSRWGYTLTAILVTVLTGLTDLVQKLDFPVPPLGHLGAVIGPTLLAVGVFKHKDVFDVLTRTRKKLESMNEIAAGIAHEVRNPLASIKGAARLQEMEIDEGNWDEARKYQKVITEEVDRLDGVLAGFMDFTKPVTLKKRKVCIGDLVRRTVEMASLETQMLRLSVTIADDIPECEVDPVLMGQVFINLIRNSMDACGPDGHLHITVQWVPPHVRITFTDNGPGFNPQHLGRVMEPFFTTKKSGMGIGLALCRRIITGHGGKFEAGNDPQGGAAVVVIMEPARTQAGMVKRRE